MVDHGERGLNEDLNCVQYSAKGRLREASLAHISPPEDTDYFAFPEPSYILTLTTQEYSSEPYMLSVRGDDGEDRERGTRHRW